MTKIEDIKRDLQSFADDESDVIYESNGAFIFTKQGKDISFTFSEDEETGAEYVQYEGNKIPYKTFLAKEVAKLDIFASKLIEKRSHLEHFVNSGAQLKSLSGDQVGSSLDLLFSNCKEKLYATKITFITADAGHGKTALLREFQFDQAKRYLNKESNFVFWHVDLQGRSLVRLNEALMYDLGELRISGLGLYHASVMCLIRHGLLVLAIDGFDELAAEIGGSAALGSMSYLVGQLEDKGTIIAASRRTFFNTQDYVRRTKMLKSEISPKCEFQEIKLDNWNELDVMNYIQSKFPSEDKDDLYRAILNEVQGNVNHPILTRPFLVTKILDILVEDRSLDATSFTRIVENPIEGIASVVETFAKREVSKWKLRDTETGNPYLTFEQHIKLLQYISEQMWESQTDQISNEAIEFFTTSLCEDWGIEDRFRQRVVAMATSHALLIPADGNDNFRKFEHEEFKNYFIARALADLINDSILEINKNNRRLKKFLSLSQLPDSVAQFASSYLSKSVSVVQQYLKLFASIVEEEWKPTYLQLNVGTLVPFILDDVLFEESIQFDAKINYSSLCFENKTIVNVSFINGTFINISFRDTKLAKTHFISCNFNELRIYRESENNFTDTFFDKSNISLLSLYNGDGYVDYSIYTPEKMVVQLNRLGFVTKGAVEIAEADGIVTVYKEPSEFKKALLKFLNIYNRASVQYESNIMQDNSAYKAIRGILQKEVIPFLEKNKIISEAAKTKSTRQVLHKAWGLNVDLEDLLKSDGVDDKEYSWFWKLVDEQNHA